MSLYFRSLTLVLAGLAGPLGALAQSPQAPAATSPSQSSAQSEAGEPRAATSADVGAAPTEVPAPAGARAAGAHVAGGYSAGAPTAGAATAGTPAHPSAHPPAPGASGPGGKAAADRLELGTATVTGDREQPKVMYIVPWKKSDIGDLSGKPMNSLLDEALAPVDRDEFKRQVMYYQVVKADASQNGASKAPAAQGEK
jgi:hypothetical protein